MLVVLKYYYVPLVLCHVCLSYLLFFLFGCSIHLNGPSWDCMRSTSFLFVSCSLWFRGVLIVLNLYSQSTIYGTYNTLRSWSWPTLLVCSLNASKFHMFAIGWSFDIGFWYLVSLPMLYFLSWVSILPFKPLLKIRKYY